MCWYSLGIISVVLTFTYIFIGDPTVGGFIYPDFFSVEDRKNFFDDIWTKCSTTPLEEASVVSGDLCIPTSFKPQQKIRPYTADEVSTESLPRDIKTLADMTSLQLEQSKTLTKLAEKHGVDTEEFWTDVKNKKLKKAYSVFSCGLPSLSTVKMVCIKIIYNTIN